MTQPHISKNMDDMKMKKFNQVDYIALETDYVSRLLFDSKNDEPKFRFKLPFAWDKDQKKNIEWNDWLLLNNKDERALEEDECKTNNDQDCYRVVLLSDSFWGKGLYLFTEDAKELTQNNNFEGAIVFRRTDKKSMNISEYMSFAKSININYCGCYRPSWHDDMCILTLPNGKTMLYVSYDCESG